MKQRFLFLALLLPLCLLLLAQTRPPGGTPPVTSASVTNAIAGLITNKVDNLNGRATNLTATATSPNVAFTVQGLTGNTNVMMSVRNTNGVQTSSISSNGLQWQVPTGNVGVAGLAFNGDPNAGLAHPFTSGMDLVVNSVSYLRLHGTGSRIEWANVPMYWGTGIGGNNDTPLVRDGAAIMGWRGAAGFTNRIYRGITNGAVNAGSGPTNGSWVEIGNDGVHGWNFVRSMADGSNMTRQPLVLGTGTNAAIKIDTNNNIAFSMASLPGGPLLPPNGQWVIDDELLGDETTRSIGREPWILATAGTGALSSTTNFQGGFGVKQLLVAAASDRIGFYVPGGMWGLTNIQLYFEARVMIGTLDVAATTSNTFVVGVSDSIGSSQPSQGVFFYNISNKWHGVTSTSGNYNMLICSNSVEGGFVTLAYLLDATGTNANFYMGGADGRLALQGSMGVNVPRHLNGTANQLSIGAIARKIVGATGNMTNYVDYMRTYVKRTGYGY